MNQLFNFSIIEAPSILGLKPSGVELLPNALRKAGLYEQLNACSEGSISPPAFNPNHDPQTGIRNLTEITTYSRSLADAIEPVIRANRFPIVLGGDCSILIGNLLALRRMGHYGLFFIDGHADFYQPEAEPNGEVASMDLAIVTGHGPDILTNIDGLKPLMREEDVILFGYRDAKLAQQEGSQDVQATQIEVHSLDTVRQVGVKQAAMDSLNRLQQNSLDGFWIHLDADVLDDVIMPAVDYRMPDGLSFPELIEVLQVLMASPNAIGINITIFNPKLDLDGSIAQAFTQALVAGLSPRI